MAPPQTRSLRSKKRTCPTDESSQTQEVQVVPLPKDAGGDIKEAEKMLQQTDLQESAAVPNIQHEGEERLSLSKADENNSEEVDATDVANSGKEETPVCDPSHRFELETCCEQTNDCTNANKTGSGECSRWPGLPQMSVPAAEDDRKPNCDVLEKQVVREECSNLKRSQDTNDNKPSCGTADVKESAAGLPAKKKRRMGMCGLTEKERSHFLQAQQRESVEDGAGKAVCDETADSLASEDDVPPNHLHSTPPHASADVREEREEEPQPDDHQAETEVHSSVIDTDETGTARNPGCSEERDSEAKDGSLTDPELNGNTEPIQLAQEGEGKHLENPQPPKVKDAALAPEIQSKTEEDLSPREQTNSLHAFITKQQEESDADAAHPQTCSANRTTDESKLEGTDGNYGGEEGASSAATQSAELHCEASLAPTAQQMSNSCDPNDDDDDAAVPSVVHTERAPTRNPENLSGSGVLDDVSDSQLNTIVLIEEMKEGPDPSGHFEDATELICGLIRELSSLNRKVMVAHRELENLRRKPSRSSVR